MVALTLLTALVSALSLAAAATPAELAERAVNPACVSGDAVHIIVARASTELPGEGIIGQVATMVKAQLPGSTSEAISYPATLYPYLSSEAAGVSAMTSAGAHVVGDALCGSSGLFGGSSSYPRTFGTSTTSSPWSFRGLSKRRLDSFYASAEPQGLVERQLSSSTSSKIVAAIQMGDPSFTPGQRRRDGFADRLRSYCDTGDQFCASGYSTAVHLSYVQKCGSQAASFVVSRARATA
ncbi:cutinase [Rhodotorula diobovata]|uniref:Cutinase n=1 Tax=Rhodotorula diobovata TaxID=5288 RepID=A0A5C5G3X7_9BASI|nr:cutinase [Rhodotorula diobovata]